MTIKNVTKKLYPTTPCQKNRYVHVYTISSNKVHVLYYVAAQSVQHAYILRVWQLSSIVFSCVGRTTHVFNTFLVRSSCYEQVSNTIQLLTVPHSTICSLVCVCTQKSTKGAKLNFLHNSYSVYLMLAVLFWSENSQNYISSTCLSCVHSFRSNCINTPPPLPLTYN